MATLYSTEATSYLNTVPPAMVDAAFVGGALRRYRATITLATQTTSDTIVLFKVRRGICFAFGLLASTVSLGSSQIAIGITGTTGKYRAAAVFTAVETPTLFGLTANSGAAATLTTDETIFITISAASLPASGTLVVDMYFSGS